MSYGWSGGTVKHLKQLVEAIKWEVVDSFEFVGSPTKEKLASGEELGAAFARQIRTAG